MIWTSSGSECEDWSICLFLNSFIKHSRGENIEAAPYSLIATGSC